jgi:hypothetical protein
MVVSRRKSIGRGSGLPGIAGVGVMFVSNMSLGGSTVESKRAGGAGCGEEVGCGSRSWSAEAGSGREWA